MIEKPFKNGLFFYAPNHLVVDYLDCGWLADDTLEGTSHGLYSTVVWWLCSCEPPNPKKHAERCLRGGSG